MKKYATLLVIVIMAVISVSMFSCKHEDFPKGIVTVMMEEGDVQTPVKNAMVRIEPALTNNVGFVYKTDGTYVTEWEKETDEGGMVTFEFKYECIMKVTAWSKKSANDSLVGEGILILKTENTAEETVIIE